MPKLVAHVVTPFAPARFPLSGKEEAKRLLERILNQNEQGIGLFFLYQDADLKLGEPSVAMLRVTVSIKSEHYSDLVRARVGRLKPEFQAKLGWLLGNLYNRPATPDWADQEGGAEKFEQLVKDYIGGSSRIRALRGCFGSKTCWFSGQGKIISRLVRLRLKRLRP